MSKLKYIAGVVVLVLSIIIPSFKPVKTHATASPSLTGSSSVTGDFLTPTHITDLQVSAAGDTNTQVHLFVSSGSLDMTNATGLTFTGNTYGTSLYFSGSVADINTALATLEYTQTQVGQVTLEVSLTGPGEVYNPTNGHIYKVVTTQGCDEGEPACYSWDEAKTEADNSTYGSVPGYLATITSQEENDYLSARLTGGAVWFGASDAAVEGDWKWVDGPEANTSFYSGLGEGGHVVGDNFNHWNPGEPNNSGDNENCMEMYAGDSNGNWNDLPCSAEMLGGYLVEYGAEGNLPEVTTKNITLITTTPVGTSHNIASCEQLESIDDNLATQYDHYAITQNIDCSAVPNFEPIGHDSNGYNGEPFRGSFDGQGHTISGINMEYSSSSIGLFQYTRNAVIRNLNLHNGTITVNEDGWTGLVGSLIGNAESTSVSSVTSDMTIVADSSWAVGGIVGYTDTFNQDNATDSTITDCSYTGEVTGSSSVGGIVGSIESYDGYGTSLSKSFSAGTVTGSYSVGGIVGSTYTQADQGNGEAPTIISLTNNYSQSQVTADNYSAGGIVGIAEGYNDDYNNTVSLEISKSYSSGQVTANSGNAGGIIGLIDANGYNNSEEYSITDSFVAGRVQTDSEDVPYALAGGADWHSNDTLTLSNNWYDSSRTQVDSDSYLDTDSTEAVTQPDYFFNGHANAPLDSWNFNTIWAAHEADFPTFGDSRDTDDASATTEDAAPNGGDANGDGILDSIQGNVTSVVNPVTDKYASLEVTAADGNTCVAISNQGIAVDPMSTSNKDSAFAYPAGLMNFTINCSGGNCMGPASSGIHAQLCPTSPGYTVTVAQYFYGSYDASKFIARKYNSLTHSYTTISGAVVSNVTIGGQSALKIVYQITDGGVLDQDGEENGTIVDPSGPALNILGAPNTGIGRGFVDVVDQL